MPDNLFSFFVWFFGFCTAAILTWKSLADYQDKKTERERFRIDGEIRKEELRIEGEKDKEKDTVVTVAQIAQLFDKIGNVEKEIFNLKISGKYNEEKLEGLRLTLDSLHETLEDFKGTFTQYFVNRALSHEAQLKSV